MLAQATLWDAMSAPPFPGGPPGGPCRKRRAALRLCPQGNDVEVIPADLFRTTHQLLLAVLRRPYEAP